MYFQSRLSIIDTNSVLRIVDLTVKNQRDDFANFKRSDVWSVVWSSENPESFATMEKIKMYVYKDTQPEVSFN